MGLVADRLDDNTDGASTISPILSIWFVCKDRNIALFMDGPGLVGTRGGRRKALSSPGCDLEGTTFWFSEVLHGL